jgi:hypothetical protein
VVNGGESNTATNVRLTRNYPVATPSTSGWHVRVHDDRPDSADFRAYADCINGLTRYERVSHPNLEIATGANRDDLLECPAGPRRDLSRVRVGGSQVFPRVARRRLANSAVHER